MHGKIKLIPVHAHVWYCQGRTVIVLHIFHFTMTWWGYFFASARCISDVKYMLYCIVPYGYRCFDKCFRSRVARKQTHVQLFSRSSRICTSWHIIFINQSWVVFQRDLSNQRLVAIQQSYNRKTSKLSVHSVAFCLHVAWSPREVGLSGFSTVKVFPSRTGNVFTLWFINRVTLVRQSLMVIIYKRSSFTFTQTRADGACQ